MIALEALKSPSPPSQHPDQQAPFAHGERVALEDPLRQEIRGAHVGAEELEAGVHPPGRCNDATLRRCDGEENLKKGGKLR